MLLPHLQVDQLWHGCARAAPNPPQDWLLMRVACGVAVSSAMELRFVEDGIFVGDVGTAGFAGTFAVNGSKKAIRFAIHEKRPIEVCCSLSRLLHLGWHVAWLGRGPVPRVFSPDDALGCRAVRAVSAPRFVSFNVWLLPSRRTRCRTATSASWTAWPRWLRTRSSRTSLAPRLPAPPLLVRALPA